VCLGCEDDESEIERGSLRGPTIDIVHLALDLLINERVVSSCNKVLDLTGLFTCTVTVFRQYFGQPLTSFISCLPRLITWAQDQGDSGAGLGLRRGQRKGQNNRIFAKRFPQHSPGVTSIKQGNIGISDLALNRTRESLPTIMKTGRRCD